MDIHVAASDTIPSNFSPYNDKGIGACIHTYVHTHTHMKTHNTEFPA